MHFSRRRQTELLREPPAVEPLVDGLLFRNTLARCRRAPLRGVLIAHIAACGDGFVGGESCSKLLGDFGERGQRGGDRFGAATHDVLIHERR
jgi:hypothetical protein